MMEQLFITLLSLLFFPVVVVLLLVIVLASLGKSLGIRRRYVTLLLKVFEFGRGKIDSYNRRYEADDNNDVDEMPNREDQKEGKNGLQVIHRDMYISAVKGISEPNIDTIKKEFHLSDIFHFTKCGIEAICDDEVTKRFSAEELSSWNLLTRTNMGYHHVSVRLTVMWCIGFFVRYFILLPFRVTLAVFGISWLIITTAFVGYFPKSRFKRWLNQYVSLMCFRILARACSAIVNFHNTENRAKNGICVANHTSPIDVIILSIDNCYAMVGQAQGGLLGVLQRAMARATAHIWFERSEVKDRELVTRRLQEHVNDKEKLPILIFPEGTCINNTSVMMFKKGSFEVGSTIYPVAIKYDMRFGDAFWNSSKEGMVGHLFNIMTSWALVCDVWYLPPMTKKDDEDAVGFANRVKAEIARRGGLVDLEWDGQLKRSAVKESWKEKPQQQYSRTLKVD